ncbi:hypothetical protein CGLO_14439 [Colletotrichum gloeosporioides Cg-14]|uniref:Uncharacterized protein n=1 Tax=Colletotrichum gloeosporioides (strain Cg-14) TaxID=1237896 RepID=T0K1A5_COLGC|nr:hypothetical protein CGLO_14439 [Colletotrichum gloeosporioides Cg-14]
MTDKINIEVEAYDDGIFLKKYYEADDQIPVNAVIGYIGEANEQRIVLIRRGFFQFC